MIFTHVRSALHACVFLVVIVSVEQGASQDCPPEPVNVAEVVHQDTLRVLHAGPEIPPMPRWHSMITNLPGDWAKFGGVAVSSDALPSVATVGVLTGALMAVDVSSYHAMRSVCEKHRFVQAASDVTVFAGDGRTHLGLAAAFGVYGVVGGNSRALRVASHLVEAHLAAGIVVQLLKRMTGRESPGVTKGEQSTWHFFPNLRQYQIHQSRYYAFPSGHIASTMATVTVLTESYPEITWLRPVGYTIVGLVGVSLVNVGYHWYSDLPLGIALGYTFGKLVTHTSEGEGEEAPPDFTSRIRVAPAFLSQGAGMSVALLL
jgi:membrane-associated phospholipid phosphatase